MSDVVPFAERIRRGEDGLSSSGYRVGYRCAITQAVLIQLEIPAQIVERTVLDQLSVVPRMTPDGMVSADFSEQTDRDIGDLLEVAVTPISELVARSMASGNLRLEETRTSDLEALRNQLEQSLGTVRDALAMVASSY
ncbi:hypothetical protein [Bradyrhizobium australiense]|uniref:Uncharacterized protein n=1 Tax=Bradyrhizobium australiense TaxID=2721161 RepID=A0A7Y4GS89_9BRAD|nr:hypothetical protein [Bradyrhizobium australiense]NOJ41058.1 hypothetical protein [Bradyrhizobium australiense]